MSDLQRARDRVANLRRRLQSGEQVDASQLAEAESLVRLLEGTGGNVFDKAQKVQATFAAEAEKVREDRHLSDRGRRAKLAALWQAAEQEMAGLRRQHQADLDARETELRRRAYGPPSGVTHDVFRDALGFVDQHAPNAERAGMLLQRAHTTGDTLLARAVATVAHERGYSNVVRSYAHTFDDLGEVAAFNEHRSAHGTPKAKLAERMHLSLSRPRELDGLGLNHITDLVAEASDG